MPNPGVAIGGSSLLGAGASIYGASKASSATKSAAAAQLRSTEMQIAEMRRQFDYQAKLLQPMVDRQILAGDVFQHLMGFTGLVEPRESVGLPGSQQPVSRRTYVPGTPVTQGGQSIPSGTVSNLLPAPTGLDETRLDYTGSRGQFIDPNLDPTRLADVQRLPGHIADTRLAPEDPSQDIYRNYVSENLIAAPSLAEDEYYGDVSSRMLAEGAAGQGVYGEEFMESPGYAFQLEEMNRALDRRNSAGGNYGGEALREAMRQAQGLAAQDYYNWAQGRTQDLIRRGSAEATDAGRLDRAAESHVQRGIMDVNREDSAMLNYLARRETDTARMDTAISEADRLEAADIARGDQAYYNYLANTGRVAGFSDAAGQAVNASQNQAAMISNVYGRQGDIYAQRGENEANIAMNLASNINDAGQSAINNYMLYQYLQ